MRISQRDKRIIELQEEIDRLLNEYQDLFDLKVQLDTELKAYQNLLEGEESRYLAAFFSVIPIRPVSGVRVLCLKNLVFFV